MNTDMSKVTNHQLYSRVCPVFGGLHGLQAVSLALRHTAEIPAHDPCVSVFIRGSIRLVHE